MNEHQLDISNTSTSPSSAFMPVIRSLFGRTATPYTSPDAFRQLYERTYLSVYRFVYSVHGGPVEDVEDITAETFERAWNGRARFRGGDDAAVGWLLTIAHNVVVDQQRREQRRPAPLPLHDLAHEPPSDTAIEYTVLGDEQQRALLAALHTLPVEEREMIVLHYVLGWQIKRIAVHYHLRPNTTSVKLRRALDRLRHHLRDQEEIER